MDEKRLDRLEIKAKQFPMRHAHAPEFIAEIRRLREALEICKKDPWTWDDMGTYCHFCGADKRYLDESIQQHEDYCSWMLARRALGLDE